LVKLQRATNPEEPDMYRPFQKPISALVILGFVTATVLTEPGALTGQAHHIAVNGVRLTEAQIQNLEQRYRIQLQDGAYWYDRVSGAWGRQGGPTVGFTLAGLDLGGALRTDASGGGTGVFINGRELHPMDALALQQLLGSVQPGRYWLDAQGNAGYEGGPALINLAAVARSRSSQGDAYSTYTRSGDMFGSDGNGCLVFSSKDATAMSSGCN
jgi:hypothetical protein